MDPLCVTLLEHCPLMRRLHKNEYLPFEIVTLHFVRLRYRIRFNSDRDNSGFVPDSGSYQFRLYFIHLDLFH
jgi:hypothetical protein